MSQKDNLCIILGCGGHARSVADIALHNGFTDLIFVDDKAEKDEHIFDFPVRDSYSISFEDNIFIAIGDNIKRLEMSLKWCQFNIISITSKHIHLGQKSIISKGTFVGNYVHIGPEVFIGEGCIINNGAVIEHEVQIGRFSHIGPNATVSGRSQLGENVFIGVGATVIDSIAICSNVIVGAGSTVIKNITEPGTYVGSPARKLYV